MHYKICKTLKLLIFSLIAHVHLSYATLGDDLFAEFNSPFTLGVFLYNQPDYKSIFYTAHDLQWVRSDLVDRDKTNVIEHIKAILAITDMRSKLSGAFSIGLPDSKFGINYPCIEDAERSFLLHIHNISQHKSITTLEIGAGIGLTSWKTAYAFCNNSSVHYVNELSEDLQTVIRHIIEKFVIHRNTSMQELKKQIRLISGNCFQLLSIAPTLRGAVDAIYVQNVEHFFNPNQHQLFLGLLDELLVVDGYAFLVANYPEDFVMKARPADITYPADPYKYFVRIKRNPNEPQTAGSCDLNTLAVDDEFLDSSVTILDEVMVANGKKIFLSHVRNFFTESVYIKAVDKYNEDNKDKDTILVIDSVKKISLNNDSLKIPDLVKQKLSFAELDKVPHRELTLAAAIIKKVKKQKPLIANSSTFIRYTEVLAKRAAMITGSSI
jgi:hypothetical protein